MGILDTLWGGGKEKAAIEARKGIQKGQDALWHAEREAEGFYDPYMKNRQQIYDQFQQALQEGADPSAYLNKLMGQYQMSPQIEAQIEAGTQGANRGAAAAGLLGSSATQRRIAGGTQAMRAQDMQNFLGRALGLRQQYLGGLGGLEQQGFGATSAVSQMRERLGQELLGTQSQIGAARGAQAIGQSAGWTGLMNTIGKIIGFMFGGPMGAQMGGSMFGTAQQQGGGGASAGGGMGGMMGGMGSMMGGMMGGGGGAAGGAGMAAGDGLGGMMGAFM